MSAIGKISCFLSGFIAGGSIIGGLVARLIQGDWGNENTQALTAGQAVGSGLAIMLLSFLFFCISESEK